MIKEFCVLAATVISSLSISQLIFSIDALSFGLTVVNCHLLHRIKVWKRKKKQIISPRSIFTKHVVCRAYFHPNKIFFFSDPSIIYLYVCNILVVLIYNLSLFALLYIIECRVWVHSTRIMRIKWIKRRGIWQKRIIEKKRGIFLFWCYDEPSNNNMRGCFRHGIIFTKTKKKHRRVQLGNISI